MASNYRRLLEACVVAPGSRLRLRDRDPAATFGPEFEDLHGGTLRERTEAALLANRRQLERAQDLLWASNRRAVLLVFQGMDTSGKDGTIKHVMAGLNPQGCEVHRFAHPTAEELEHNFLWRYWIRLPARGRIGIYNRSHYEEVLVVRVHPELLDGSPVVPRPALWRERYEDINRFEQHLVRNGTVVLKFFLHLSKAEQKRRLLARLEDPRKQWKFSIDDVTERRFWDEYRRAYEAAIRATSTDWAPWFVVPADHKYVARAVVASLVAGRIGELPLEYPTLAPAARRQLLLARRRLLRANGR